MTVVRTLRVRVDRVQFPAARQIKNYGQNLPENNQG